MTLIQFFRIVNRNFNLFVLCSLVLAITVFLMTKSAPEIYESETEIFTGIASGFNVESIEKASLDFFATSNAYDNLINVIKSRQTLEEVGERLLIQHMMLDSVDPRYISEENYGHFRFKVTDSLEQKLLDPNSVDKTLENIKRYKKENYNSFKVRLTFEDGGSPYSYKAIQNIQVYRIQNSDLVKITYSWSDPGICQNTLKILNEVFTQKLASIKQGQSSDVVEYFKDQVKLATERLTTVEQKLKDFRIRNRIINYNEQTKSIASLKEQMEDEYQKELGIKASAEASVMRLEEKLQLNKEIVKFSDAILEKRQELAELNSKIAQLEVYYNDLEQLAKVRERAEKLKAQLSNDLQKRYQYGKTTEGVPIKDLLSQWLESTLRLDASKARLEVFEKRKEYFRKVYDEFAPLGSEIARLEREIAVEEKNYLELLHSLNLALMRQRSEALATGGVIVTVPPHYPLKPRKSKTTLLVLVAAVIGFVVPFGIVLIIEFLDNTVRTPQRAEELTGLKLLGAYPNLTKRSETKNIDMGWLKDKSAGLMTQNTRLESRSLGVMQKKPKYVMVFSTRFKEGKLLITHTLANELVSLNFKVLVVSYKELEQGDTPYYDHVVYEPGKKFISISSIDEVVPSKYNSKLYDYVFVILKGVLTDQYPLDVIEGADMGFCVVNANRNWNRADTFALKEFSNTLNCTPRLIINGVEPDFMNTVLGDIEKNRSLIRRIIKSLLTLQFHTRKFNRVS